MSVEKFTCRKLKVEGACVYELPETETEDGGSSVEVFNILKSHPCPDMPQIMVSRSKKNTIRGLHCSPHHKMVCCPSGKAYDVVVDLRPDSPTFMQWDGAWLTKTTHIVVPPFCGHGFFAAEDDTAFCYLQGGCFAPALDFSVLYNDPAIGVEWPAPIDADDYVISPKDRNNPLSGPELFEKIKERLEKPIESLKLGPYADFAIVLDGKCDNLQTIIETIQEKDKKWHVCFTNGNDRDTLQEELYALKPFIGVLYIPSNHSECGLSNFVKVLNVASSAEAHKFPLTVLLGPEDFKCKDLAVDLLKKNGNNIKFVELPTDKAGFEALISSLIE